MKCLTQFILIPNICHFYFSTTGVYGLITNNKPPYSQGKYYIFTYISRYITFN